MPASANPAATRVCRFCEKTIPAAARTCPECLRDITGRDMSGPVAVPAAAAADQLPQGPMRVSVVDVDMPFGSMVLFMVKWSVAAIPALLILSFLAFVVAMVFGFFFGLARLAS